MPTQIVVAGAVIRGSAVLVAQSVRPPELAEELGLEIDDIAVGDRLGDDIPLNGMTTLRAYRVRLIRGEPHPHDHQALRWVTAAELHDVDWVPADRGWLADLTRAL